MMLIFAPETKIWLGILSECSSKRFGRFVYVVVTENNAEVLRCKRHLSGSEFRVKEGKVLSIQSQIQVQIQTGCQINQVKYEHFLFCVYIYIVELELILGK